jgi:uncharacterized oxidoreductase
MKISGNTILITGGTTGIGFALAEAFLKARNDVIICGRREHKLQEAQQKLPELHIKRCDVAREDDRKSLFQWATSNFKNINILINNAGIQREIDFSKPDTADSLATEDEVAINLTAPIHLSALFVPRLVEKQEAAIVNISSGLAFIPIVVVPVYCATKAGIHSFSISLRHQLRNTQVKVFEVIAPTTDTELDRGARGRRGQTDRGIPALKVAEATLQGMERDEYEIAVGMADMLRQAARTDFEKVFHRING